MRSNHFNKVPGSVKLLLPLYLFILIPFFTSCTLEMSDNGKLDGFWQLKQLDTISTGGQTDMRDSLFFWAVQKDLLEIKDPERDITKNIVFRFNHTGDSLILTEPYYSNRDSSDIKIKDPAVLNRFGIYNLREAFFVTNLTSDELEMKSDRYIFHFRKY